jgi:ABC-type transport system involved in cytochrome c biogenesis permease subunit
MSLWEYANPVKFLSFSGKIVPWFAAGAAFFIACWALLGIFPRRLMITNRDQQSRSYTCMFLRP